MSVILAHPHAAQYHAPLVLSSSQSPTVVRSSSLKRRHRRNRSLQQQQHSSSLITIPEQHELAFMRKPLQEALDLDEETWELIVQARSMMQTNNNNTAHLTRCPRLDGLARQHALRMAQEQRVHHSVTSISELQRLCQSRLVGENIHKGQTVADMHKEIMQTTNSKSMMNRSNLLSSQFCAMGTGVVLGEDGLLYSCQLFRGPITTTADQAVNESL